MTRSLPLPDHPQRGLLAAEVHARPSMDLEAPIRLARIALLTSPSESEAGRERLAVLCRELGLPVPSPDSRFHMVPIGGSRLRWERHTEFSSWTVATPGEA